MRRGLNLLAGLRDGVLFTGCACLFGGFSRHPGQLAGRALTVALAEDGISRDQQLRSCLDDGFDGFVIDPAVDFDPKIAGRIPRATL